MQTNMWKKGLVLAIFIMFICIIIIPDIGANLRIPDNIFSADFTKNTSKQEKLYENPPNEEWNKTFGGTNTDYGFSVDQTTDGGYIITGGTDSYGAGSYDTWLVKTDSNGTEEWNQTFGGTSTEYGYSVQQASDGGYIITGRTDSFGIGGGDLWLIKTDSVGDEVWNKTFGGEYYDVGYCVQLTSDGGYILTGWTMSYGDGKEDVWLVKTDSNGTETWNQTYGGLEYENGQFVQQTSDGGFIVIGKTDSFGEGHTDLLLVKTDSNGTGEWMQTFGGIDFEFGYCVQQTSDGGYILTGRTGSYGAGTYDVWLIKTDPDGSEMWSQTYGGYYGDDGYCVQQTIDGGYIITGDTWNYGAGSNDVWLIKTDSNGTEEWNQTFGGTSTEYGYSVQQTTDEGYIITGLTDSFGVGYDLWLIKVEKENNPPYEPSNPYPENNSFNIDVETNLSWTGGDPDGDSLTYDVYFEANDSTPDVLVSENQTDTTYNPGTMNYSTRYYWKIIAWDEHGFSTEGPVWDFTTSSDSNHPPNKPIIYYENITLFANATDIDDDDVMYFVDWGDGSNNETDYYPSGKTVVINHTFSWPGVYYILVKAIDIHGAESDWSDPFEIIIENNPPETPDIDGPSSGVAGKSYDFTFNSVDFDGDDVYFYIIWGDGYLEDWEGPYESGEDFVIAHSYSYKNTYVIEAKARDIYGDESLVATHEINIPRTRDSFNLLLLRLFNHFSNAFLILRQLLGLF